MGLPQTHFIDTHEPTSNYIEDSGFEPAKFVYLFLPHLTRDRYHYWAKEGNRTLVFEMAIQYNKPLYDFCVIFSYRGRVRTYKRISPDRSKICSLANLHTRQWWWVYGLVYRTSPFKKLTNPGCGETHHLVDRLGIEPNSPDGAISRTVPPFPTSVSLPELRCSGNWTQLSELHILSHTNC